MAATVRPRHAATMAVRQAIAADIVRLPRAGATVLRPAIVEATAARLTAADRARVRRPIAAAARCLPTTEAVRPPTVVAAVATTLAAHRRITAVGAVVVDRTVEAAVADRTAEVAQATPAVIANRSDLSTENAARKGGVPF